MTILVINKGRNMLASGIIVGSFISMGELNNNPAARMQ